MKIYLIEEDRVLTKIHSDFMSDLGHELTLFDSLSSFFEAHKEKVCLAETILVDSFISHKESIHVIKEIRKICPDTKLIVMSASLTPTESICYDAYSYNEPMNLGELESALIKIEKEILDLNGKIEERV